MWASRVDGLIERLCLACLDCRSFPPHGGSSLMNVTLSPTGSPRVRRRGSTRRPRAGSHLPPFTQESHEAALNAIRTYLKGRTSYDTFPVSFRLIVLDSKLEVRKALQCLLLNGISNRPASSPPPLPSPTQLYPRRCLGTIMEQ